MKKVQQIVRSMPWFIWTPGLSVCYNNTSYTRTKRKRNFKFEWVKIDTPENKEAKEYELICALQAEGHKVSLVSVSTHPEFGGVQVWLQDEPIQVVEAS